MIHNDRWDGNFYCYRGKLSNKGAVYCIVYNPPLLTQIVADDVIDSLDIVDLHYSFFLSKIPKI